MGNASMVPSVAMPVNSPVMVSLEQVIDYVMPIYYTKLPLLPHCKEKLIVGWKKISANTAQGFYKLKQEHPEQVPCPTPMEFFANRLILRLCEVHPVCQAMFTKSHLKQGTALLNMFSSLIRVLDKPDLFNKHLKMLALSHIKIGVRATECKEIDPPSRTYLFLFSLNLVGIFGEALFWTLRVVLGSEDYDTVTHTAWIKFYSRILDGIVPIVLEHETKHAIAARDFNVKRMMPIMATTELIQQGLVDDDTLKIQ